MDYEKRYKEAFEIANAAHKDEDRHLKATLERIFPELKESEDERIRKGIIRNLKYLMDKSEGFVKDELSERIDWLENQGIKEQLYIRFGEIPTDEKSKIYRGEIEVSTENGVSVYPAFETNGGDIILGLNLPITKTSLHTQQHLLEYENRPCYLVTGDYVGKGTDGEPLIKNVKIIKEIKPYRIKQVEQKPIMNIPSREVILSIWDLGNEWKELTGGCISSEYGTQLDYIQKHWNESEYYLREKQGKQETLCDKCRKEQPSHSCQDITELGRCALEHEQKSDLNKEENIDNGNKVDDFQFELNFDFSVGQWIVAPIAKKVFLITKIEGFNITLVDIDGDEYVFDVDSLKNARLWTLQDAKPGDVLFQDFLDGYTFIYDGINPEMAILFSFIIDNSGKDVLPYHIGKPNVGIGDIEENKNIIYPATKEQRNLLFQKMEESGYEWDAENKKPKKIKPIFHEGDWICNAISLRNISSIKNGMYYFYEGDKMPIEFVDRYYHLWTINDAKKGDVIVVPKIDGSEHSEQIFIFKEIKDRDYVKNAVEYYCRVADGEFYVNKQCYMGQSDDNFVPATKEQHELLFKKMHEASYEWYDENKALKIKPKFNVGDKVTDGDLVCEIESIDEDCYYCDYTNFDIKDQDKWKFVDSKFHEGDWIISSVLGTARIIGTNDSNKYLLEYIDGKQEYSSIDYVNYEFDKWTIKDAMPGDILAEDSCIFMIQKLYDNNTSAKTYCALHNDGEFNGSSILYFDIDSTKPATKEQRELLVKKMNESGYKLLKPI